jgi:lipopolysaccharide transport system permease protein
VIALGDETDPFEGQETDLIDGRRRRATDEMRELWQYRELLAFLTWRDVAIRYKQALLGVAWAVIQPVMTMLIFSVVFGTLAKLPSGGVPYPLFSYAGLLPWQLFSGSVQRASQSVVGNTNLITKVYFPRLVVPLSAVGASIVDTAIASVVFVGMLAYYGVAPTWRILLVLPIAGCVVCACVGVGTWLSALNVKYRDVQHAVPFLLQVWMYASPVAYSSGLVPKGVWRMVYYLNPMAGLIEASRWALVGGASMGSEVWVSVASSLVMLVCGLFYFRRTQRTFADVI